MRNIGVGMFKSTYHEMMQKKVCTCKYMAYGPGTYTYTHTPAKKSKVDSLGMPDPLVKCKKILGNIRYIPHYT